MEARHDPFFEEVAEFEPKKGRAKLDLKEVEKAAHAAGFENRSPKPVKEPLKPLQFRIPESDANAFRQLAYKKFGPGQGAIVALFRDMWKHYPNE
jgi:hypothetical protein